MEQKRCVGGEDTVGLGRAVGRTRCSSGERLCESSVCSRRAADVR